jgi:hypothetical protein
MVAMHDRVHLRNYSTDFDEIIWCLDEAYM